MHFYEATPVILVMYYDCTRQKNLKNILVKIEVSEASALQYRKNLYLREKEREFLVLKKCTYII